MEPKDKQDSALPVDAFDAGYVQWRDDPENQPNQWGIESHAENRNAPHFFDPALDAMILGRL